VTPTGNLRGGGGKGLARWVGGEQSACMVRCGVGRSIKYAPRRIDALWCTASTPLPTTCCTPALTRMPAKGTRITKEIKRENTPFPPRSGALTPPHLSYRQ
jgi:hypothetical protein